MADETAEEMIEALETFLASNLGVTSITVDGTSMTISRSQALSELRYWKERAAKADGTKRRFRTIDVGRMW